jgi:DNA polymerase (family 10)
MKNLIVSRILIEIADLLEMQGVEYKPRAYRKAARTVRSLPRDIEEVKEDGQLTELPGIGKNIAKKIEEIIETGSSKYHEDLKKEFPIDFEALRSVEGLGPKTIRLLYTRLGVKDLDDLEKAARTHEIRDLAGMGEKTEQNILRNLEFARQQTGRNLLGFILPIAEKLKNELLKHAAVNRVEIAGSIRRRKETVGDIDVLVTTQKPKDVMEHFTSLDSVSHVIAKGEAKSTVRLREGLESDLRVIRSESFGSALMYFTGSKETNIKMRKLALKRGLKLNEYGLFENGKQIAGTTEQEVFKQLGMTYIEPELRENRGEIEAALEDRLPELISYGDLRGDLQIHTKWSDGSNTILEMAKAAKRLGHEYLAITDHTGSLRIAGGLNEREIMKQMKEIEKVNKAVEGLTILKGVEVNIKSDGKLDVRDEILRDLDIVVASIHSGFRQGREKLTERMISAMENENVDIIAHPTGRLIQERKGYELDFEKVFETSVETSTFLEINAYPNRLDLNDASVKRAIEAGCRLVISTDSHSADHLRFIQLGIATARRGWARKDDILNTLPLNELIKLID